MVPENYDLSIVSMILMRLTRSGRSFWKSYVKVKSELDIMAASYDEKSMLKIVQCFQTRSGFSNKLSFCPGFRGPEGLEKVREKSRIHFHPSWYLMVPVGYHGVK